MQAEGEVAHLPTGQAEHGARFDTFVEEEHVRLFKALYFVTGSREEAEDLAQEAFLKLWERWDRIDAIRDPTAYLFRVALNGFRMRRRRAAMAIRKLPAPPEQRDGYAEARCARTCDDCSSRSRLDNGPPFCLLTSSAIRPSRPRASSGSDRASDEPLSDPRKDAAWRKLYGVFVNRFSPGRLIYVDAPHYMEPEIPARIARELERVIAASSAE